VTSDWLLAALWCGLLAASGWPWVPILAGRRPTPVGRAGLAYLTGTAMVTLGMLAIAFVHISISRVSLLVVIATVGAMGLTLGRRARPPAAGPPAGGRLVAAAPVLGLVAAALAYLLIRACLSGAVDGPDFVAFWGRKGLAVFYDHNLDFVHARKDRASYPLEVSNLYGGLYLFLGHVNDQVIRLPLVLMPISMTAASWWLCRLVLSPLASAVAVALPLTTPEIASASMNGLVDAAVAAYVTVCVLASYMWVRDDDPRWASLAGLAAGAAAWCKLEGALTGVVLLVTVSLLRRRIRGPGTLPALGWLAAFTVPWLVFRRLHGITADPHQFSQTDFNLPWIISQVSHELLLRTGEWGLFWIVCPLVIVLAAPLWWRTPWRNLAALTLPNLIFTLGAYVVTFKVGLQPIEITVHRLYLHLAPSVAVMAAASTVVSWEAFRSHRGDRGPGAFSCPAEPEAGPAPFR
jgi:hypothetical protein